MFIAALFFLKNIFNFYFFKDFIYLFLERGKGGRKGEKHHCVVASYMPPTGDLACNPGMFPAWESNRQPFGLQAGTQSTEPHQPRRNIILNRPKVECPRYPSARIGKLNVVYPYEE